MLMENKLFLVKALNCRHISNIPKPLLDVCERIDCTIEECSGGEGRLRSRQILSLICELWKHGVTDED